MYRIPLNNPQMEKKILIAAFAAIFILLGIGLVMRSKHNAVDRPIAINAMPTTFSHPKNLFGDTEKSVENIERLNEEIEREPQNTRLHMERGLAYKRLILLQSASSNSDDYIFMNEWAEQAREDFTTVIKNDASNVEAFFERATVGSGATTDDGQKTMVTRNIDDLTKAVALQQNVSKYFFYRGLNYLDLQQPDRALTDFNDALQRTSSPEERAEIKIWRAPILVENGEYQRALDDYNEVLKIMPNYEPALQARDMLVEKLHQ